jgi:hypothetical protein
LQPPVGWTGKELLKEKEKQKKEEKVEEEQ